MTSRRFKDGLPWCECGRWLPEDGEPDCEACQAAIERAWRAVNLERELIAEAREDDAAAMDDLSPPYLHRRMGRLG